MAADVIESNSSESSHIFAILSRSFVSSSHCNFHPFTDTLSCCRPRWGSSTLRDRIALLGFSGEGNRVWFPRSVLDIVLGSSSWSRFDSLWSITVTTVSLSADFLAVFGLCGGRSSS